MTPSSTAARSRLVAYSQSPIAGHIFQQKFRLPQRVTLEGLLGMVEIWRELALSVGCRFSQILERNE